MEQLAHPIRQLLTLPRMFKSKAAESPAVRMSEINRSPSQSFNLSENFKNISRQMAKLENVVGDSAITQLEREREPEPELHADSTPKHEQVPEILCQELNDLDFKKFVDDLSLNVLEDLPAAKPSHRHPTSRIIYERTERKETIIIDSLPNRDSDDVQVVKVKITLPKDSERTTITVQPITNCTSTFKRSKLSAIRAARSPRKHENAHHLPIMGKAALMNKRRNSGQFKNNDSEIVRELVTQRFQDCLLNYYEKSFHRQSSRVRDYLNEAGRDASPEPESGLEPLQSTFSDDLHGISSIASESMLSVSRRSTVDTREASSSSGTCSRSFRASTACSSRLQSTNSINSHATTHPNSCHLGSAGCLTDDMKFLLSTDALNVETTNEINVNHSTFAQYSPLTKSSAGTLEETLEYDATQFLKDALGDELNNYYSTDASYMNSIGTSNISALISKADTHEYNNTIYEDSVQASEYDYYPFNKRVSELLADSNVQYQVILQTSKALSFCRSTKEFSAGEEELEAERILLLATCKRDAIRDEIHRLEYEEVHLDAIPNNYGRVRISQIILPPKQRSSIYSSRIFDKKKKKKFADWYLCILSHGTTVLATAAVQADSDGFVRFRDEIAFDQLSPDFEIHIALYSMRVRSAKQTMSHETKYHLENDTTLCPLSPPRIFNSPRQYKSIATAPYVNEKSSYMPCGQFTLRINNIGHFGHFKMSHLNLPTLEGNFIMDFSASVSVKETYSGFLDVGLENGETIVWNRRWCTLCEGSLRYYNYPGEENPLGFIDLYCCATASISSADRQICARPRTLLVEIFGNADDACKPHAIIKYFLAADSKQYMEMWGNKLNSTVSALRTWNALKCAPAKY